MQEPEGNLVSHKLCDVWPQNCCIAPHLGLNKQNSLKRDRNFHWLVVL